VTDELGNSIKVTYRDVAILKEMCLILEPIANATARLEADSVSTSGPVLPVIIGLSKAVNKVQTEYCTSVKTGIANSLDRRFGNINLDDHYIISAVLEPRFKLKWTASPLEVMMVKSCIVHHMESAAVAAAGTSREATASSEQLNDDDLLSFINDEDTTLPDNASCVSELDTYLADSNVSECLQFWQGSVHKYTRLYPLHLKHHCIPATSAAMERCFSAAGYIVKAWRSRLSDQMLEDMLVAKCYKRLSELR